MENYGQPRDVSFRDIQSMHFSCLDERITVPSLMTPGGDLGEFLLALSLASPKETDPSKVEKILKDYLRNLPAGRRFYHCTDDAAIEHLQKVLGDEGLDLANPTPSVREELLRALGDGRNNGDSFFRLVLKNPTWFHVHEGLAADVIRAFFKILWDTSDPLHSKLMLDILPGVRDATAFLEIGR